MVDLIKKSPVWSSVIAVVIINVVLILFRMPRMVLGNLDFLVGLFLIVLRLGIHCGLQAICSLVWRFHIRKRLTWKLK